MTPQNYPINVEGFGLSFEAKISSWNNDSSKLPNQCRMLWVSILHRLVYKSLHRVGSDLAWNLKNPRSVEQRAGEKSLAHSNGNIFYHRLVKLEKLENNWNNLTEEIRTLRNPAIELKILSWFWTLINMLKPFQA